MSTTENTIEVISADGFCFNAYHVPPTGPRKGGLVMIMDIFGVTPHVREVCDDFARYGYEILSPHLFDRIRPKHQSGYSDPEIEQCIQMRSLTAYDTAIMDVQACLDRLKPAGKVGVFGFCYGAVISFLAACRCTDVTAASTWYGSQIKNFVDETPHCPMVCHFAERDEGIPLSVVHEIREAQPGIGVFVYPAEHGFYTDQPELHDPNASALSQKRTLRLFSQFIG